MPKVTSIKNKYIGISISECADLARKGYGKEHLRVAMVHIARLLLHLGADLAYGGDLRLGGFTRILFDVAWITNRGRDTRLSHEACAYDR